MLIALLLTTTLLILSKFLDCYTTSRYMKIVSMERNRLARKWMYRYGKNMVIWVVFALLVIISLFSFWWVWKVRTAWYWQWGFIISGLLLSYAQFSVAHSNYSGKLNYFTRWLIKRKYYQ
ncbi:MAG: hypothetical protein M9933_10250 [Chitinophagaceae bacterium]|nr:hypothetical protein [Chitinophagaceae bacterium]